MKLIPYWIQRADLSTAEFDPVDVKAAILAYESHPWHRELALEHDREIQDKETCPAGIGFVAAPGHILHICPGHDTALIHYHFDRVRRILGLFSVRKAEVLTAPAFPSANIPELIERFFQDDHAFFCQKLERAAA